MINGLGPTMFATVVNMELRNAYNALTSSSYYDQMVSIGRRMTTNTDTTNFPYMDEAPSLIEWIGDLTHSDLSAFPYKLSVKNYAASIAIDQNQIDDDNDGVVMSQVRTLANVESRFWGTDNMNLLLNGTSGLAMDGVGFFSAASGARINNNLATGTISLANPTLAQVQNDITTVQNLMMSQKTAKNVYCGVWPDTYIVSSKLYPLFRQAFYSTTDPLLPGGGLNALVEGGRPKIIASPMITDLNDFYALSTTQGAAPVINLVREDLNSFIDFGEKARNRKVIFGVKMRGVVGYGFPMFAVKCVSGVA